MSGYAGHDRLMDGRKVPNVVAAGEPMPTFVLACYSESYFAEPLREHGADALVLTDAFIAPEGYAIEALVRALAENKTSAGVREEVAASYAHWQRLGVGTARRMFGAQ